MVEQAFHEIKAIIGLGNPGDRYYKTRHSIGFRVLDELAQRCQAQPWKSYGDMQTTTLTLCGLDILAVKPQTFMNNSGAAIPFLKMRGLSPEQVLVIHDELELPFGKLALRFGGGSRGHNGLKSIIAQAGQDFSRLRCGIGRPEVREDVPDYVLAHFTEGEDAVTNFINQAADLVVSSLNP